MLTGKIGVHSRAFSACVSAQMAKWQQMKEDESLALKLSQEGASGSKMYLMLAVSCRLLASAMTVSCLIVQNTMVTYCIRPL